jgi:hypothetical protein
MGQIYTETGNPIFGSAPAMFALGQQLVSTTQAYVDKLILQGNLYNPITITATFPTLNAPPQITEPATPALQEVVWNTPGAPAAFTILPPDLTSLFPQAFDGVAPVLNFGSLPQPSFGAIPPSPAVDLNFTYPDATVNLPTAPTLMTLDTISFQDFVVPDFEGTVPVFGLVAPTPINYVEGARYTSQLLTDVTNSLQSALTDGTDTGLDAQTQQAMSDAAYERELRANGNAITELERMEALGYAFPPGVYLDARIKIQTETAYTLSGLSREIYVKQAELRLENVMKSRELAISLESKWMDYINQVYTRLFEAAKYQTEAQISVYNAQVQSYVAQVEGFKATIQVYDAYIRGIEARIAVLKAHVEFETAKVQINTALVEQYRAQIQAAMSVLEIAKIQVEIIQTRASVEKTKVDIFGAQVQAFVATVNAYTAEVEGYKANAEAQGAIEGVYKTQVEAYSALVQAGTAQANARVEGFKAQVQGYEATLDGYKAELQAMVEQARAASEFNQAVTAEYSALVGATSAYNQALTAQWQAIINEQIQVAEIGVKAAEANAQIQISQRQITIDAIKAAATVLSQLGAAALNAIHFANTSNWNSSDSVSTSVATSTSTSTGSNKNTNYNYSSSVSA